MNPLHDPLHRILARLEHCSLGLGLRLGLGSGSGGASAAPGATSALYVPYDGMRIIEGASAGAAVATLPFGSNTTRTITGVTNAAGSTVTNVFAITGANLVAGSTPSVASDSYYNVTVHEVGSNTTDTTIPIYVAPQGVAQADITENFTGTPGTTVGTLPGWSIPTGGNSTNVTTNGTQCAFAAATGSVALRDTGTLNHKVSLQMTTLPVANGAFLFARYKDGSNFVRMVVAVGDSGGSGAIVALSKVINAGQVVLTSGVFIGNTGVTNILLELRIENNRAKIFANGVEKSAAGGYDVSDVAPSPFVGIGSSTVASVWDNFTAGQSLALSANVQTAPVYAVDPTAQKAQVPIAIAFTGTPPASLEWRLEDPVAGTAITSYDWTALTGAVIGASGAAGIASAPSGGNYVWAVRDAGNPTNIAKSAAFGVGDVPLGIGQSNMQRPFGSGTYPSAADSNPGKGWLGDANAATPIVARRPGQAAMASFLNTLISITGRPAWFPNFAAAGQAALYFSPTYNPGGGVATNYWNTQILPYIRANQLRASAILSMHGETDCEQVGLGNQSTFIQYTKEYIAAICAATGQRPDDIPIGFHHVGQDAGSPNSAGNAMVTRYLGQRKIEAQLAAFYAKGYLSSHRWDMDNNPGDYIHIDYPACYTQLGPRLARGYAKKIGSTTVDRYGPIVTSAVKISNTVVRVTIDPNGSTSLSDTTATKVGALTQGWQIVAASGYTGSQDPDSYFNTPALTPVITVSGAAAVTTTGAAFTIDLTITSTATPVAIRYMAAVSGSAPARFDGSSAFTGGYGIGVGNVPAAAQFVGVYSDASTVGIAPMISAVVAV